MTDTTVRVPVSAAAVSASGAPTPRENLLFLVGAGVLALHVADDNFFQPNAGTSATDHLASGLVPLALLALAAAGYRRLRPGLRAAMALTAGVLGLVMGIVEAGYSTYKVGPSGDDFTGLLTLPVSLGLLVLGTATLWKSRRLDERPRRRYLRRAGVGFLAALVAYQVIGSVSFAYVLTHATRPYVPANELDTPHEDVSFTTSDGLKLVGWYIPSKNGAAVIAFPGRKGTQAHARLLAKHGYGVLLFDRRGEGESEGDSNLFGWDGDRDVHAAVDFLKGRPDVDAGRIGGMGFSVGGEMMLQAAANSTDLAAIVSEGAGTRSFAEQREDLGKKAMFDWPGMAIRDAATVVLSNSTIPPKLSDQVQDIAPRPVFFIWAPNGGNLETLNPVFHRLAGENASIWEMPTAKHIMGIAAEPAEYERRVIDFFDKALALGR